MQEPFPVSHTVEMLLKGIGCFGNDVFEIRERHVRLYNCCLSCFPELMLILHQHCDIYGSPRVGGTWPRLHIASSLCKTWIYICFPQIVEKW